MSTHSIMTDQVTSTKVSVWHDVLLVGSYP